MAKAEIKPIWSSSSFLVYTGGLTVLYSGLGALAYLATQYPGHGQQTAWALLIFVILYAIAYFLRRADRPLAAGIFAYSAVTAWVVLVLVAFNWWGWDHGDPFRQWSWSAVAALLLALVAAGDARRRFRFPYIRSLSVAYFFLLVNVVLPAGGSWTAVWALLVGLLYLVVGTISDKPSTFWLHLAAGLLIGGAFLYWFHASDGDFAFISIAALVFVLLGYSTRRSSWAVLGTIGFFIATVHYLIGSPGQVGQGIFGISQSCSAPIGPFSPDCSGSHLSAWSLPLGFGLLGFWLVFLGILGKRKRTHTHTTVVVETPAPTVS